MASPQLLAFLIHQTQAGASLEEAAIQATKKGWAPEDVNGSLAVLRMQNSPIGYAKPSADVVLPTRSFPWTAIIIVLVCGSAALAAYFYAPLLHEKASRALTSLSGSPWSGGNYSFIPFASTPATHGENPIPATAHSSGSGYTAGSGSVTATSKPSGIDVPLIGHVNLPALSSTPAPVVTISANARTINLGDTVTLSWSATNATSCQSETGGFPTDGKTSGSAAAKPVLSTSFSITCSGTGGSSRAGVFVTIVTDGSAPPAPPPAAVVGSGTPPPVTVIPPGTLPPVPVGGVGSDEKTMAAWDVVPYDIVESDRSIGAVAYHISGISKVRYSVNGGSWIDVTSRVMNPETHVEEYYFQLTPGDYSDGPMTIAAEAIPNNGITRTLTTLKLYNNAHHSMVRSVAYVSPSGSDTAGDGTVAKPYKTILKAANSFPNADGATVYMLAGDYSFSLLSDDPAVNGRGAQTLNAFLTITTAPGVSRDSARIVDGLDQGIGARLVHLKNITLLPSSIVGPFTNNESNVLWIDNSVMQGTLLATGWKYDPWTANYPTYITDTTEGGNDLGLTAVLLRNDVITQSFSQGITGTITALNVTVHNIDPGSAFAGAHPDVDHYYGMETIADQIGIIRYRVIATDNMHSRGFAGPGLNAVYDQSQVTTLYPGVALSMGGSVTGSTKLVQNVLFYNTVINGGATWNESPTLLTIQAKDVLFQNSTVNGTPSLAPNSVYGPFSGVIIATAGNSYTAGYRSLLASAFTAVSGVLEPLITFLRLHLAT
ncbi:MAG: hypothetical protein JWO84_36 [Parcubacteria group bacterium]|nr:hypothetical protein [Parcubacteria group bacterium]